MRTARPGRLVSCLAAAALLLGCQPGHTDGSQASPGIPANAPRSPTGQPTATGTVPADQGTTPGAAGTEAPSTITAGTSTAPSTPASPPGAPLPAPKPPPAALARFYAARARWSPCTKAFGEVDAADLTGFQCATVAVPLDYRHPAGRTITLALTRAAANGPQRIGSLLLNPGGPGESGLGYFPYEVSTFPADIKAFFDLVEFDPRGVGASAGLHCLPTADLDQLFNAPLPPGRAGVQAAARLTTGVRDGCLRTAGWELPYVGTANAARDIDILRAAVGDTRTTFYGGSYGSKLGAVYAGEFPDRVRALVLDGAVPPGYSTVTATHDQAVALDRQLLDFLTDCIAKGTCPWTGTALAARAHIESLLAGIARTPLRTSLGRPLRSSAAVNGLLFGLYYTFFWDRLATALSNAQYGDGTGLLALADQINSRVDGRYLSLVSANPAVTCADQDRQVSWAQAAGYAKAWRVEAPVFADLETSFLPACNGWPRSAAPTPTHVTATGAPPILVVGNTGDPSTPYQGARDLAASLTSGHLLTFVGDGHTIYGQGNRCIDTAVNDYLIDLTLPRDGTRCHPSP